MLLITLWIADFHPCTSDFAGNGRVLTDKVPDIDNCNDLLDFFPDLFDKTNENLELGDYHATVSKN
jgi:hypothetical protein